MSILLDKMKKKPNVAYTENGALAKATTNSGLVNLYADGGSYRSRTEDEVEKLVRGALDESVPLGIKLIFYLRDIKGAGEKRFFKVAMQYLAANYADELRRVVPLIPLYGRWDNVVDLIDTPLEPEALAAIVTAMRGRDKMAGKWLPREGSDKGANDKKILKIVKAYGFTGQNHLKQYRKLLKEMSDTLEHKLAERDYESIDFAKVQGKALTSHKEAFKKRMPVQYKAYVEAVKKGEKTVKVGAQNPYELLRKLVATNDSDDETLIEAQWYAQPNYLEGGTFQNVMPIVDVSSSMESKISGDSKVSAMDVSMSLGLYVAERIKGYFKNHVLTFSTNPQIVEITGKTLKQKFDKVRRLDWSGGSTDLVKAFQLILTTAMKHKLPQSELPDAVLIISDMEFNSACGNKTPYQYIKAEFEAAGYKLPVVVFWNVCARNEQYPVTKNEPGCILTSGYSAGVIGAILKGQKVEKEAEITPFENMMNVLESERYDPLNEVLGIETVKVNVKVTTKGKRKLSADVQLTS